MATPGGPFRLNPEVSRRMRGDLPMGQDITMPDAVAGLKEAGGLVKEFFSPPPRPDPGIMPLRPKGFGSPFKDDDYQSFRETPHGEDQYLQPYPANTAEAFEKPPSPEGLRDMPSGFGPGTTAASVLGGGAMAPQQAVNALRGASPDLQFRGGPDPTMARLDIARTGGQGAPLSQWAQQNTSQGFDRTPQDMAWRNNITNDVQRSLAPQQAGVDMAQGAMQRQHPAVRGEAEAEARRRAMPSMAQAQGLIESADIQAEQRSQQAMMESLTARLKAAQDRFGPQVKGLTDIITGPGDDAVSQQRREWATQALVGLMQQQ